MDKYKTSLLGQALKKVYKGEITVKDCILLAEREISEVFSEKDENNDDGFVGDIVCKCPRCQGSIVRTKFGYGCTGYKDGCNLTISNVILGRTIPKNAVIKLVSGEKVGLDGFVSKKSGKAFPATLKLNGNKAEFEF